MLPPPSTQRTTNENISHNMTLRVFTTFSGYDSQCLALDRLPIDYELVGWSEIDRYAIQAHNALYPQWADRNYGDITKIDWAKVPDFDLFTYSSPCQDFSQAGLQRGGEQGSGTRSSLLWECERAIAAKKPKYLLMENVAALVSQKFIKLFNRWQVVLQGYGYKSFPQVLNAKDYGVPQNRERIFLVSILDEEARYEFPKKEKLTRRLKDVLETEVDERYYLNDERVRGLLLSTQTEYGKEIRKQYEAGEIEEQRKNISQLEPREDGVSNTLTSVQKDNLVAEPTDLVRIPTNTKEGEQTMELGGVADLSYPTSKTRRGRVQEGGTVAPTQNTQLGRNHETKIIEPINTDSDGNARTINAHYECMNAESVMSKPKDGYGYVRTAVVEHEPKIIDDTYKGRKPREYTENAPAIRSEREGFKVVEQEIVIGSMQSNAYRGTTDGFRIRKLTPRECFRLMDVDDADIDKIQEAGISNSQQYKLAGNSIVVACLYHIFRKLFVDTQQENEQLKLF